MVKALVLLSVLSSMLAVVLGAAPTVQHILDTVLAFAVINRHFDVADYLLEHGANINTDWNSHEPASPRLASGAGSPSLSSSLPAHEAPTRTGDSCNKIRPLCQSEDA
jgi:hypothetical protein